MVTGDHKLLWVRPYALGLLDLCRRADFGVKPNQIQESIPEPMHNSCHRIANKRSAMMSGEMRTRHTKTARRWRFCRAVLVGEEKRSLLSVVTIAVAEQKRPDLRKVEECDNPLGQRPWIAWPAAGRSFVAKDTVTAKTLTE